MAFKRVKVKLKEDVTRKDFWRATYNTDSNLGIRLVQNFDNMKKNYLEGKLSQRGSLEVAIPVSYYNRERETIDDDIIEYGYIKEMKNIWEIVE
ncbi:hypothetical protein [Clostridium pasteurianum]|uniref:Uncharacterized protein n=1 Tax=Clostridium pasteurianum BC1 TaxID=86416 RepID=R4K645_CLOPA|nr:hypothetical protein [Clostridium pasteurianum]AGK97181.1 hypothetical protein Clopa_2317 [Clostridium pasteurianum BC1]